MRANVGVALACVTILAAAGCAMPEPADLEYAESARRQVGEMLGGFARAIRNDDAAAAMSFVDPQMPEARRLRLERALGQVVWMTRYTGYEPDVEQAASSVSWHALKRGQAEVRVPYRGASGEKYEDRYLVVRREDRWFVGSLPRLPKMRAGEQVDPPEEEARRIRREVKFVFDNLKEGRPGRVYAALPKEDTDSSVLEGAALGALLGGGASVYSVYEDLQIMQGFEIRNWPDPDKELPLVRLAPTVLIARYNIPYTWAQGGIYTTDNLRFDIYLVYNRGTWRLQRIRLAAKGLGTP